MTMGRHLAFALAVVLFVVAAVGVVKLVVRAVTITIAVRAR